MKIAFVHDRIVYLGGAENVLADLISQTHFDDGKIFTLYSTHKSFKTQGREITVVTALPSWINNIFAYFADHKTPIFSTLFDYRNLMFWFPLLTRLLRKKIQKYQPDEIIISSFAAVKNIISPHNSKLITQNCDTSGFKVQNSEGRKSSYELGTMTYELSQPKVVLYLHSPMQYIWENYQENVSKLPFPIKQFYKRATSYLRPRDKLPRHYDVVLCNSGYTAELAKQLYNIDGHVQHPYIDQAFIDEPIVTTPKNYFIFVGRVQRYVREIDRIIELCNTTKTPLIIMGSGPDIDYAKSIAGDTITFVGQITDVHEKITLIKNARGLINIAKESFGIGTAEALCLGVPVFGYSKGATPELVDDKSGTLVSEKDSTTLIDAFTTFSQTERDRKHIAQRGKSLFQPVHSS